MTAASVRAVVQVVKQRGADCWFESGAAELLQYYEPKADPDAPAWLTEGGDEALERLEKGKDIFMSEAKTYKTSYGSSELVLETGKLAKQADGAVTIRYGDTMMLVSLDPEKNKVSIVSIPRDSGVTSSKRTSLTSPFRTPP